MPEKMTDEEVFVQLSHEWQSRCVSLRLLDDADVGDGRTFWRCLLKDALRDLADKNKRIAELEAEKQAVDKVMLPALEARIAELEGKVGDEEMGE